MGKRKSQNDNNSWKYWVAAIAIILTLVVLWPEHRPEVKKPVSSVPIQTNLPPGSPVWYGEDKHQLSVQFADRLSKQINPEAPENAYMPSGLKSRINWIVAEKQAGRLSLICAKWMESSHGKSAPASTLMGSKYEDNGNASIAIIGPMLYRAIAENGHRIPEVSQEWKNYFAIGLAHEVIHLDNKPFLLKKYHTTEELTQEELRTWMKTSAEVVRPLRDVGQPVGIDHVKADDASRHCNYQLPCPELLAFFRTLQ